MWKQNQRKFPHSLDVHYLCFTAVSSRTFPAPIKAGRLPLTQNLVKLSRSLNRSPRTPSLISPFTQLIQVERTWDLVRDSGQRKLTSSFQNHCTLHSVPVGAKPLSSRQCAPLRSIYLSRRLNSHWEILITTHHLQKWESQLRLRSIFKQIFIFTHLLK